LTVSLFALAFALFVASANARTLHAEPVDAGALQPIAADFRVDGGAWQPCVLGGAPLAMACPLDAITTPGYYVLTARYVYVEGEAISKPYNYVINAVSMSIVSSFNQDAHAQAAGGAYVTELHTDTSGKVYTVGPYLAPQGLDVPARVAANAAALALSLADAEADQVTR